MSERVVPAAMTWGGGSMLDASVLRTDNWAGGVVPGANDSVTIGVSDHPPWVPAGWPVTWGALSLASNAVIHDTGLLIITGAGVAGDYPSVISGSVDFHYQGPPKGPAPGRIEENGVLAFESRGALWNSGGIGDGTGLGTVIIDTGGTLEARSNAVGFNWCDVVVGYNGKLNLTSLNANLLTTVTDITIENNGQLNFTSTDTGQGARGGLAGDGRVFLTDDGVIMNQARVAPGQGVGWLTLNVKLTISGGNYTVDTESYSKHSGADLIFTQDVYQDGGAMHLHGRCDAIWYDDGGIFKFELGDHPTICGTLTIDDGGVLSFDQCGNESKVIGDLIFTEGTYNLPLGDAAMVPKLHVTGSATFGSNEFGPTACLNWFVPPNQTAPANAVEFFLCDGTVTGTLGELQVQRFLTVAVVNGQTRFSI
ncbi:MAG: hypothetical protein E6G97_18445 [Alphaproteobacteria bacterium]|nr:MAG: hypothetical protein E6G97_18445 [Alphaproteobacteria bacterium]